MWRLGSLVGGMLAGACDGDRTIEPGAGVGIAGGGMDAGPWPYDGGMLAGAG